MRAFDANLSNGWSRSVEQDQERAELLVLEVLDREPNNARAHKLKGILRRFEGRLSEAQAELETAIAFDRNDTFSLRNLGITLVQMGRPEAAIPYIEKSFRSVRKTRSSRQNLPGWRDLHLVLGQAAAGDRAAEEGARRQSAGCSRSLFVAGRGPRPPRQCRGGHGCYCASSGPRSAQLHSSVSTRTTLLIPHFGCCGRRQ